MTRPTDRGREINWPLRGPTSSATGPRILYRIDVIGNDFARGGRGMWQGRPRVPAALASPRAASPPDRRRNGGVNGEIAPADRSRQAQAGATRGLRLARWANEVRGTRARSSTRVRAERGNRCARDPRRRTGFAYARHARSAASTTSSPSREKPPSARSRSGRVAEPDGSAKTTAVWKDALAEFRRTRRSIWPSAGEPALARIPESGSTSHYADAWGEVAGRRRPGPRERTRERLIRQVTAWRRRRRDADRLRLKRGVASRQSSNSRRRRRTPPDRATRPPGATSREPSGRIARPVGTPAAA